MIHAVKALIYNSKREIFLQQRDYAQGIPFPGHWTFFGGLVEKGESLKEALKRELIEELGFKPKYIEEEIFTWEWKSKLTHLNHCFPIFCDVDSNQFQLKEGLAMKWFSPNDLYLDLLFVPGIKNHLTEINNYLSNISI